MRKKEGERGREGEREGAFAGNVIDKACSGEITRFSPGSALIAQFPTLSF